MNPNITPQEKTPQPSPAADAEGARKEVLSPSSPPPSTSSSQRHGKRRKAFDAVILLVFAAVAGYICYRFWDDLSAALYSSTAMIILVVMVIEFLILKSFDRTRLYRLENERLVRRRNDDLRAMREAESVLKRMIQERLPGANLDEPPSAPLLSPNSMIAETPEPANETPFPEQELPDGEAKPLTPDEISAARRTLGHLRKRIQ